MPQSLSRILVRLIFSTKNRAPVLRPAIGVELHPYLAVVLRDNDCPPLKVGRVEDHVHLFFGLPQTPTVAKVVERVQVGSIPGRFKMRPRRGSSGSLRTPCRFRQAGTDV